MRHAIVTSAALLMLGACAEDDPASSTPASDYATGELPTADTVRESELHVASQQEQEDEREEEHSQ